MKPQGSIREGVRTECQVDVTLVSLTDPETEGLVLRTYVSSSTDVHHAPQPHSGDHTERLTDRQ